MTNNYGIDQSYVVGLINQGTVDYNRDLFKSWNVGATYIGTLGRHLDMLRAPNRGPNGLRIAGVQSFSWQSSEGESYMNGVSFRVQKRQTKGIAGSASYNRLPELLVQLEAGGRRVTGLSLDTRETFDTPLTRRDNPHRAYITIIEGCDKSCAYCVVPFTRGPERSRTSESVLREASQLAAAGYTEVQLLGQNVNSYRDPSPAAWDFARSASVKSRPRRTPSPRALK